MVQEPKHMLGRMSNERPSGLEIPYQEPSAVTVPESIDAKAHCHNFYVSLQCPHCPSHSSPSRR